MSYYDDSPFGALEERRAALQTIVDNRARTARCSATWETNGTGEIEVPTAFTFPVTFVEEPCFTSGHAMAPGVDLVKNHFPRVSAGVSEWIIDDERGFYTGAYVYFVVDTNTSVDGLNQSVLRRQLEYSTAEAAKLEGGPVLLLRQAQAVLKEYQDALSAASYKIVHHLAWEGMSFKDVPGYLLDL